MLGADISMPEPKGFPQGQLYYLPGIGIKSFKHDT